MKKFNTILKKEWANFRGSERGVFFIYGIIVISWSFLPLNKDWGSHSLWWLFFSVIISGNFTNSVFVAERLSGSMEILLTSGFPRTTVFFGKIAFVVFMSVVIGMLCFCLSFVWQMVIDFERVLFGPEIFYDAFLFCAGTLMNVTFGAWMSFRLQSPRIIPFMTIMVMGVIVTGFYGVSFLFGTPQWTLGVILAVGSVVFGMLAIREFKGEKVIQPIHL
jgi:ABC-type Na+ efflux pump permease subunit